MTRKQRIDIILKELDNEITIPTYQENRVRKCLGLALTHIEEQERSETCKS